MDVPSEVNEHDVSQYKKTIIHHLQLKKGGWVQCSFFFHSFSYPFFKLGNKIEYCVILIIKETLKHTFEI